MTRRGMLFALSGASVLGQTRQEQGKKVIDGVLEALGGGRYLAMQDRVETGRAYSFYREELSGRSYARIYTRYLTRPEPPTINFFGLRERQSFGKDREDYAVLFTENEGWSLTFRGARPISKETEDRFRDSTRRNLFYILRQRLGEPGLLLEFESREVVDNQPVEIVSITDSENRVVRAFIHASTKLPVKQEYFRRDEKTRERIEELTRFSKYRDVGGGVQWPYAIQRERNDEKIFEMFADEVKINQDLTDNQYFSLSSKIKILPPAR